VPSEFDLIERCFKRRTQHTLLGIGDDAALIVPTPGHELAVSTDLLVEGTHFFPDADPEDLGWKTLAVNISDLAAMGATPRWATLGIAVPLAPTSEWLDAFARGFFACADEFSVDLIGGDTTRTSLGGRCFSVTIMGEAPAGKALRRSGAQPGDQAWVSGTPGRAARGLAHLQGKLKLDEPLLGECLAALHRPQPRIALGLALRGIATSAIDVSDGLLADLGHILEQSGVAAVLDKVPNDSAYLTGGDDYELVFTAPVSNAVAITSLGHQLALPLTCIGHIKAGSGLLVLDENGSDITPARRGYDHFHE
jgi:thiamine-monophosphate kinase